MDSQTPMPVTTSRNRSIVSALASNNYGATLVRAAKYEDAIPEFKLALQLLQSGMAPAAQQPPQQPLASSGSRATPAVVQQDSQASPQERRDEREVGPMNDTESMEGMSPMATEDPVGNAVYESATDDLSNVLQGPTYLYQTPITIPQLPTGYEDDDYTMLTYTVTFNLALACLLSGLSVDSDEHCLRRLRTARRLYELTFQMQIDPDILLLTAVLNNLSFIHRELGNDYEANECERQLLSAVLYLVDQGVIYKASRQVDGFLGNVMHLIVSDTCAASAA